MFYLDLEVGDKVKWGSGMDARREGTVTEVKYYTAKVKVGSVVYDVKIDKLHLAKKNGKM